LWGGRGAENQPKKAGESLRENSKRGVGREIRAPFSKNGVECRGEENVEQTKKEFMEQFERTEGIAKKGKRKGGLG